MRLLVALASVQLAAAGVYPGITTDNHTCARARPILSCSPQAQPQKVDDTCCVETYGGLLVATQFWSLYTGREHEGQVYPKNSWTIHGLWPDFCNGSYTQYCDLSRQYDPRPDNTPRGTPVPPYKGEPIDRWFAASGKRDLLAYMNRHWIAQRDRNWVLWAHEFSKHATCFSTFQTECYGPKAAEHADLFDFFETVVRFQRALPTFRWLAEASIRPSNRTAYTLADVQRALTRGFGLGVARVYGRPQEALAKKLAADAAGGRLSTCAAAKGAIWYHQRASHSER
ncbi:hypothetical protein HIM_00652 [Hirsutella minnesotensis 3608]|nr:hypothetical protein HIM_00652 [Hirsutella minnesotensis 3608]